MKEITEARIDPKTSALLIVDMQKEIVADRRAPDPDRKRRILPTLRALAERAREAGVRVVYTQSVRTGQEPEFTVYGRRPVLVLGTPGCEIMDELGPDRRDVVVRKWCADPWHQTDMDRVFEVLLPEPPRSTVLLTGGSISGCAYFAITGLHVRGYRIAIVTDAIYEYSVAQALRHLSRTTHPRYPNVTFTRSDLITFSRSPEPQLAAVGR